MIVEFYRYSLNFLLSLFTYDHTNNLLLFSVVLLIGLSIFMMFKVKYL